MEFVEILTSVSILSGCALAAFFTKIKFQPEIEEAIDRIIAREKDEIFR